MSWQEEFKKSTYDRKAFAAAMAGILDPKVWV